MRKSITLLLAVIFCLALLTSCGKRETDNKEEEWMPETESSNVFDGGCYMLADFETYMQCAQIRYGATFGKVTRITDKNFVTHGSYSIKCEVFGREEVSKPKASPYIKISTASQYFKKSDFTDCDAFLFDIYNAMPEVLSFWFCISEINVKRRVDLTPGWNYVEIPADASAFTPDFGIEIPEYLIRDISSFIFIFDRGELHEQAQTFYFDNFRARKKT